VAGRRHSRQRSAASIATTNSAADHRQQHITLTGHSRRRSGPLAALGGSGETRLACGKTGRAIK
jgi:hypothetical protein